MKIFVFFVFFYLEIFAKTVGLFVYPMHGVSPWDPGSVRSGIAGSEEAVIYMAQELADLGHDVIVFGNPPPGSSYSEKGQNPLYVPFLTAQKGPLDVAIVWRVPALLQAVKERAHKVYFWPHDPCSERLTSEQMRSISDVFWLSSWQRNQWVSINPGMGRFQKILGNGIELSQFGEVQERKNPYSCIYGSNYARGLDILLDVWPEVKEKYPQAILDIYYGWNHWGLMDPSTEEKMRKQVALLQEKGVVDHGLVGHEELAKGYADASFWTYPCTKEETFCISALKAQMSGAIPVVISGSALQETVRGGYSCDAKEEYLQLLLQAMENAPAISRGDRQQLGQFVKEQYTWKILAKKWDAIFREKTICLNMIVKNESKAIARCLESVKGVIDEWVIVDTGSTDGTQQIIAETLKDIPGTLYERSWVNFAHNRNEALSLAQGHSDYLLLIDADEMLDFPLPFDKTSLHYEEYFCSVREANTSCFRTLLLKDGVDWRWEGIIHEKVVGPPNHTQAILQNVVNLSFTKDGYRSQNPNKYLDDAALLEQELQKDPHHVCNLFFLGQCYAASGAHAQAIDAFDRCAKNAHNPELIWFCRYIITRTHDVCEENPEALLQAYSQHYLERPSRAEPLYFLARRAYKDRNFILAYAISRYALGIPYPKSDISTHVEHWIYEYGMRCMVADSAYHLGDKSQAKREYLVLLENPRLPSELRREIEAMVEQISAKN